MSARHCPECGTNWPVGEDNWTCQICGSPTVYNQTIDPDDDLEERIGRAKDAKRFEEIGFDHLRAQDLALAGVRPSAAVSLIQVRGCPIDLAYDILR